ncbi:5-oxoprolinase subunit PxpA [Marinomonas posidonica]|uniref:LamB/YcsF family protein n=1 Tax=Marinomonas posidonica (strain CECT 7376 / NCIMB 14433 / IVIA-Po-181) TaxID=491952 RepID=F6CX34_MARPP|nr:5-oxoprolinase subunit PxpA [Marinomonas posidonica]AEF53288.1 LamB/YcsF family protein [Marinomonas posidonica IVIA-Po-181]
MKLNCDMGEAFGAWKMGQDDHIMPFVDQANIACGFHASDPHTMAKTVALAKQHNVTIGAHPAYPDLVGFGRRNMDIAPAELKALIQYQIGALNGICAGQNTQVTYVKPHGALYNTMMADFTVLDTVMQAVSELDNRLILMVMAVPEAPQIKLMAEKYALTLWFEAFADRLYTDEGRLTPRKEPDAVHASFEKIEQQVVQLCETGTLTTASGQALPIHADTICVHGDGDHALDAVTRIRTLVNAIHSGNTK